MSVTTKHIIISAGGTGGHVMPALAVAQVLIKQGYSLSWIGTSEGLEAKLVPEAGIHLDIIPKCSVQGKSIFGKLFALYQLAFALFRSWQLIRKHRASLVIGLGGYVSAASGMAAKLARVPLVIHEQNALAGRTNRLLAKIATKVLCAFPDTFNGACSPIVLGNPLRANLVRIKKNISHLKARQLNLLVVGGSLGAKVFNEVVPEALKLIPNKSRPCVWHQSGEKTYDIAAKYYKKYHIDVRLDRFIEDMHEAYTYADLIICRAGALTVSELCVVGVPAILVPYPYALDDHQRHNAQILTHASASLMMRQAELTAYSLATRLIQLIEDRQMLGKMAQNMLSLAKPNSTVEFVDVCQQLLHASHEPSFSKVK